MAEAEKRILVRATAVGYYGDQRRFPVGHGHPRAGEPFLVLESEFSDSGRVRKGYGTRGWMERVDPAEAAAPAAKAKALKIRAAEAI